jgi:hypothetical protein
MSGMQTGTDGPDECWPADYTGNGGSTNSPYYDATTLTAEVPGCIIDASTPSGFAVCDRDNGWDINPLNDGTCIMVCYLSGIQTGTPTGHDHCADTSSYANAAAFDVYQLIDEGCTEQYTDVTKGFCECLADWEDRTTSGVVITSAMNVC